MDAVEKVLEEGAKLGLSLHLSVTGLTENAPKTLHTGLLCNPWLSLVRISYVAITTTTTEICVLFLGCRCIHAHWQGTLSSPRTLADGALFPCVFS